MTRVRYMKLLSGYNRHFGFYSWQLLYNDEICTFCIKCSDMILTIALLLDTHSLEIHVVHTTRDSQAIPLSSAQPKPGFGICGTKTKVQFSVLVLESELFLQTFFLNVFLLRGELKLLKSLKLNADLQ